MKFERLRHKILVEFDSKTFKNKEVLLNYFRNLTRASYREVDESIYELIAGGFIERITEYRMTESGKRFKKELMHNGDIWKNINWFIGVL